MDLIVVIYVISFDSDEHNCFSITKVAAAEAKKKKPNRHENQPVLHKYQINGIRVSFSLFPIVQVHRYRIAVSYLRRTFSLSLCLCVPLLPSAYRLFCANFSVICITDLMQLSESSMRKQLF